MDDVLGLEEHEAGKELAAEAADEWEGEANEVVRADELVEIDGEAGRDDAEVGAEVEGGGDAESSVAAIRVLLISRVSNVFLSSGGGSDAKLTHSRNFPKIPTSTRAC